jgi:hypothetical protein
MYKFFVIGTFDEMKLQYRALCLKHHPDVGGDTRTMQDINAEWADIQAREAWSQAKARQESAHASGQKSAADYHDLDQVTEQLRIMIEWALNLDGVQVELMGLWVWLTGNTFPHREEFKQWNAEHADLKWKWSSNKTAWYFAAVPTFNRSKTTLDQIRNNYGTKTFSRNNYKKETEQRVEALKS